MIRTYKLEVLIIQREDDTALPVPWEREKIGEPDVDKLIKLTTRLLVNESCERALH